MDLSNSKLVEEDEGESMHSGENTDALNRDIEGSSSHPFAALNNGIGDANTNNINKQHILESTQMKEKPSILGNPNEKVKQEVKSEPCQLWETLCHVPEASNLQCRNNPIDNEPETPQKMSSQQAHGVAAQPVDTPTRPKILDLLCFLVPEVDKDKAVQLCNLYTNLTSNRIGPIAVFRSLRGVVDDKKGKVAMGKYEQLQQKRRMGTNQNVESTSVVAQSKSTINVTTVPNLEKPSSVNGPSTVQGGPISHLQNNSSLPLNSVPGQGSVTKDQMVGHSSSVVNQESISQSFDQPQKPRSLVQQDVCDASMNQMSNANPRRSNDDLEKQSCEMVLSTSTTNASFVSPSMTTQLDSTTMVNFPGSSGTIPAEANVKTTPKLPSVGQKKPRETQDSSQPRPSKKQKVSETNIKDLNDVTALSGVNITKESEQLFGTRRKKDRHVSEASRKVVHEEEERTIFQKIPLQRKLAEIMAKNGIKHVNSDVERCLSLCVEERMRGVLSNTIRLSKQRVDAEKSRNPTFITSDIGKQINQMNQKAKEEQERKQAEENKLKNVEENDTEKVENQSKQVKKNKVEEDKRRAKSANVAARAAVGGNDAFLKWQLMAEARKKASSGPGSNSKKPYVKIGGRSVGKNKGLKKVIRSISVKDVVAVLETEPQMSKSMLLYRLYSRICSDVQNQEKTQS